MNERFLRLHLVGCYSSYDSIELSEVEFSHPYIACCRHTVRGKTSGAFVGSGTFQWTRAVKSLTYLALLGAIDAKIKSSVGTALVGFAGSLAASLDYAIDKQPLWLVDMFGQDSTGLALVKRLVRRTNPGRKRQGPTSIAFNHNFISPESIQIIWNGRNVTDMEDLFILKRAFKLDRDETDLAA